jgi:hypothetical protein
LRGKSSRRRIDAPKTTANVFGTNATAIELTFAGNLKFSEIIPKRRDVDERTP